MSADELTPQRLEWLATAEVIIEGRMPWSSNATLLCNLCVDGEQVGQAIYKPLSGERPLWDFEPGLHKREYAAYRLSESLGLGIVPPTVLRDGPAGEGSLQWFVEADHQQHYFTIYEAREDLHEALQAFALFDLLANNTDRKSGHVLIDADDHLWGIDHGLCFAADFKLRTVIWEFGGQSIPDHLVAAAEEIAERVPLDVATLLDDDEVEALQVRAQWIVEHREFPVDHSGRRYPWPLV
ncbi:MAG: SCO1664 family protein [Ilumatobacteraceae bacterium]